MEFDVPPAPATFTAAAQPAGLLLDLRDAVVVGHSMGGMTVMRFCGDHPDVLGERVAAIALVATAADHEVPSRRRAKISDLPLRNPCHTSHSVPSGAFASRW